MQPDHNPVRQFAGMLPASCVDPPDGAVQHGRESHQEQLRHEERSGEVRRHIAVAPFALFTLERAKRVSQFVIMLERHGKVYP